MHPCLRQQFHPLNHRSLVIAPPDWLENPSYDSYYCDLPVQYTYSPSLPPLPERRLIPSPRWPTPPLPTPISSPQPRLLPRPATALDASRYNIPQHYNLSSWSPSLTPIVLLERVFDTPTFTRWLLDTSALIYGPTSIEATLAYDFSCALTQLTSLLSWARRTRHLDPSMEQVLAGGNELWLDIGVLIARCERSVLLWSRKIGDPREREEWLFHTGGPEFIIRLLGTEGTQRGRWTFEVAQRVKAWVGWTEGMLRDGR